MAASGTRILWIDDRVSRYAVATQLRTLASHHIFGDHIALYLRIFTENEGSALNVTMHSSINVERTVRRDIAVNNETFPNS